MSLVIYLVRGQLNSSVDVDQLEGHGKVLVAVCCEGSLGFGGIVHPAEKQHLVICCNGSRAQ